MKAVEKPKKAKVSPKKTSKKVSTGPSATDQVLRVIKKSKKGVSVSVLKEKTGFEDKKIRNIIFRKSKEGKIKRAGRGHYIGAK